MSTTLLTSLRCSRTNLCKPLISRRHITTTPLSESGPALEASLRSELTSRPASITTSFLDPTPSHLLTLLLKDLLPSSCHVPLNNALDPNDVSSSRETRPVPQGHHLVYFPPEVPGRELLPDGTDTLHSPGAPFVRRLWAGGSLTFNPWLDARLIGMRPSVCEELIEDVKVKGVEGDEKVFVNIQRRYAKSVSSWRGKQLQDAKEEADGSSTKTKYDDINYWSLLETRDLVFLREKSKEQALEDAEKETKVLRSQLEPDWSTTLIPTPALLFRWSALTYNAHKIHLDPQYCREVEGHRNLLAHGPLSLALMVASLRSQLNPGEMVTHLEYRNLAPLYASEEMKICIKLRKDVSGQVRVYDVWIEGPEGGIAVKGKATVARESDSKKERRYRDSSPEARDARKKREAESGKGEGKKYYETRMADGRLRQR